MNTKQYYVYIATNHTNTVFYIGVTNNLVRRMYEHKNKLTEGFTQKYNIYKLVYYEIFDDPENAILREKQMKKWKRAWKVILIEKINPRWKDLYEEITSNN